MPQGTNSAVVSMQNDISTTGLFGLRS